MSLLCWVDWFIEVIVNLIWLLCDLCMFCMESCCFMFDGLMKLWELLMLGIRVVGLCVVCVFVIWYVIFYMFYGMRLDIILFRWS